VNVRLSNVWLFLLVVGVVLASCAPATRRTADRPVEADPQLTTPTKTPFQPQAIITPSQGVAAEQPSETGAAGATPTSGRGSESPTLWVAPELPPGLQAVIQPPPEYEMVIAPLPATPAENALWVTVGEGQVLSHWVYALAAAFPTLVDGVSAEELHAAWLGQAVQPFAGQPLIVEASTLAVFSAWWGEPAPGAVQVVANAELSNVVWEERPAWALVPFEALGPAYKVIAVDGQSPLRKEFDLSTYPLSVPVALGGNPTLVDVFAASYGAGSKAPLLPASNRDPSRLTTLVMTGVTALVRATAYTMEQRGIKYPARDIGAWLRAADITHISNEVPFARNCPYPNPVQPDMRFCSDPRYIGLMEEVGTDVVELTGDHFQDWGAEAMRYTLELYRERNWLYYGGGANRAEARQAVTLEHNGNRLAFIGCNGKGGSFAQAGPSRPGAAPCDFGWLEGEIARLRAGGYLPVATFQHFEYYTYQAQPNQKRDFRRLAQAGAVIVSGSQAHQPQAFEFLDGAFIHYGLGNLFFDQYEVSQATRQAFIDRHVFYAGRYIGTELLTILFVDYARPRPMTQHERQELLKAVFRASGW